MRIVQLASFYTPVSGGLRTCLDQTGAGYQAGQRQAEHRLACPGARRHRVPLVLFSHERIDATLHSRVPSRFPLNEAGGIVNRRLGSLVDEIVVTSAFSAVEFEQAAAHVVRIPLGVDLTAFRPADAPAARSGPIRLVCEPVVA